LPRSPYGSRCVAAFLSVGLAFVLQVSFLAPRTALADDAALGRNAEGVFPIGDTEVEMVAEDVTIMLLTVVGTPGGLAEANCEFTFHNTSAEPAQVLMGFPGEFAPEVFADHNIVGEGVMHDFRAFVDGEEAQVTLET